MRFFLACLLLAGCVADEEKDTLRIPEDEELVGDCDGPSVLGFRDTDGDGYGDPDQSLGGCELAAGYVEDATDCDDASAAVHPGADEADCDDPVDYNCDGSTGYADADLDGVPACLECDDTDAAVLPGAVETCDGRDEDCDGTIDEDAVDAATWYLDGDTDGFGLDATTAAACALPSGYAARGGDCDDADAAISPAGVEVCDAADRDEDCDGAADDADGDLAAGGAWYPDADGDGYGDDAGLLAVCDPPGGYVVTGGDCDDAAPASRPGAPDACGDNVDSDCAGDDDACGDTGGDTGAPVDTAADTGTDTAGG